MSEEADTRTTVKGLDAKGRKLAAKRRRKEAEQRRKEELQQQHAVTVIQCAWRLLLARRVLAALRYKARTPAVILAERSVAWLEEQRAVYTKAAGFGIANVVSAKAAAEERARCREMRRTHDVASLVVEGQSSASALQHRPPPLVTPSRLVDPKPGYASSMSSNRRLEHYVHLSRKTPSTSAAVRESVSRAEAEKPRSPKRNRSPTRRATFVIEVHDGTPPSDHGRDHGVHEHDASCGVAHGVASRSPSGSPSMERIRRVSALFDMGLKGAKDLLSA